MIAHRDSLFFIYFLLSQKHCTRYRLIHRWYQEEPLTVLPAFRPDPVSSCAARNHRPCFLCCHGHRLLAQYVSSRLQHLDRYRSMQIIRQTYDHGLEHFIFRYLFKIRADLLAAELFCQLAKRIRVLIAQRPHFSPIILQQRIDGSPCQRPLFQRAKSYSFSILPTLSSLPRVPKFIAPQRSADRIFIKYRRSFKFYFSRTRPKVKAEITYFLANINMRMGIDKATIPTAAISFHNISN